MMKYLKFCSAIPDTLISLLNVSGAHDLGQIEDIIMENSLWKLHG